MKPTVGNVTVEDHRLRISLDPEAGEAGSTRSQVDEWLEKSRGRFRTEELQDAFRSVQDKEHWKRDIDAIVPGDMKEILSYAIPWHTGGGGVKFEDLGDGRLRVTAPGYWSNGMEG